MKQICLYLLATALLLSLTGCGSAEPDTLQERFTFTYRDVLILPGAEVAPVLEALGEPKSYTEEPSCAFEGMDKTYYYGSFYLTSCTVDGVDYVNMLWFADDGVATDEGIRIGSTQTQVEEVYGRDCFNGTNSFVLTKGQTRLVILMEEETVSSIRYEMIME